MAWPWIPILDRVLVLLTWGCWFLWDQTLLFRVSPLELLLVGFLLLLTKLILLPKFFCFFNLSWFLEFFLLLNRLFVIWGFTVFILLSSRCREFKRLLFLLSLLRFRMSLWSYFLILRRNILLLNLAPMICTIFNGISFLFRSLCWVTFLFNDNIMINTALICMVCRSIPLRRTIPFINFSIFSIIFGCLHIILSGLVNEGFEGAEFVIQRIYVGFQSLYFLILLVWPLLKRIWIIVAFGWSLLTPHSLKLLLDGLSFWILVL